MRKNYISRMKKRHLIIIGFFLLAIILLLINKEEIRNHFYLPVIIGENGYVKGSNISEELRNIDPALYGKKYKKYEYGI